MSLDITSMHKAIYSLEIALKVYESYLTGSEKDPDFIRTLKAGVVQNFEFTYELAWKFMRRWVEINVRSTIIGITRRELYRYAAENGLIEDIAKWMDYNEARNITSHTYDEEKANLIVSKAFEFKEDAIAFYSALEERNQ